MYRDEESILAREAQLIFSNVQGFNMGDSLRIWHGKIRAGAPNNQEYEFEFIYPHGYPNQKPIVKAITPLFHPNVTSDGFVNLDILERWRPEFHGYQVLLQLISLLKRSPPRKEPAHASSMRQRSQNQPISNPINTTSQSEPDFRNFRKITKAEIGVIPRTGINADQQQDLQEAAILRKQLSQVREQVTKQEEELTRIRARNAIGIGIEDKNKSKVSKELQETFKHLNPNDQMAELESEQIAISELMTGLQEKHQTGEISIFDYSKLYKKYSRDLYILKKKIEYVREKQ